MLRLFVIWPILFVLVLGCGLLASGALRRFGGVTFWRPYSTFQTFWLGYATLIAVLQIVSVVIPIGAPALALVSILAGAGYLFERVGVVARLRAWSKHPRRPAAVLFATCLTAFVIATRSVAEVTLFDTHLYHLQIVKWTRAYAAVPGIANLHYRLAFDNSSYLFCALTDVFWTGRAAHIALGFLTTVLVVHLVANVLVPEHARARVVAAFSLLVLPFVPSRAPGMEINSLSSDLPMAILAIVVVVELLSLRPGHKTRRDGHVALLLAVASAATTTKLGAMALFGIGAAVAAASLPRRWSTRRAIAIAVLPGLVFAGYFVRQAILSGWLFFPVPLGRLPFSWTLPKEQALDAYLWIESWARMPFRSRNEVLDHGFLHWFAPWLKGAVKSREFLLLEAAFAVTLVRLARPAIRTTAADVAATAAVLLSLVLWFRGAPDLRFGAVFFWSLLATLAAPLLGPAMKERAGLLFAIALGLLLANWTSALDVDATIPVAWSELPPVQSASVLRKITLGPGTEAFVPEGHDDAGRDETRCSDGPLPCTPYPAKQRLRRAGDLGAGFVY